MALRNQPRFGIGIAIAICLFVFANIYSFLAESSLAEQRELENGLRGINFGPASYHWGFPFTMYYHHIGHPNYVGFEAIPTLLNIVIVVITGLLLGWIMSLIIPSQGNTDKY
ncbi:MAG: hypothetical protein JNL64_12160 [Blastocatellia bacterium]|nr:hypothetical protein [Blastocatellia bacterium]